MKHFMYLKSFEIRQFYVKSVQNGMAVPTIKC